MRTYKYIVTFITGLTEEVTTNGEPSAIILAQAEQIKKGNNHEVESVVKLD